MISICVPTYNYDISNLVLQLRAQMEAVSVPTELLVYDDASPQVPGWWEKRAAIGGKDVTFKRLPENLGRGAIRNQLTRDARYEYILLMDADGSPNQHFLANYATELQRNKDSADLVIIGGRTYAPAPPADPDLRLHWWYGTQRESTGRPHADNPYHGFQSNNFLAGRRLLLDHPFPESAIGYGHEDTLWGQQLKGQRARLLRIDNPVVHLGLERGEVFLAKQHEAVLNLLRLREKHPELTTRLTTLADRVTWSAPLLNLLSNRFIIRHLTRSERPELRLLDLLKLKWYLAAKA